MTAEQFIAFVDAWIAKGGALRDPDRHFITTVAEVDAICRALDSEHIFAANSIHTPAYFSLAAYLHYPKTQAAADAVRAKGLDCLRRVYTDLLDQPTYPEEGDFVLRDRYKAAVFILQVLAAQKEPGDGSLIVRGARDRRLNDGTWSMVFEFMERGHPETGDILEALREPLPEGTCGDCYLYFSNKFADAGTLLPHPFATKEGIARLAHYISDPDAEDHYSVCWAVRALPFVDGTARSHLLDIADRHSDGRVRLEAAAVRVQAGSELGAERLIGLCLDPRLANEAIARLEELGLSDRIPAQAREPGFLAMAEMSTWLSHPSEHGRPPDEIAVYDTRVLNWPPTGDRRQLWILKYRYEPDEWGTEGDDGVGLVGSTTFALFFVTSAQMKPEEIYALHCCWELRVRGDPAAPKEISAEYGRNKLASMNPGFEAV
jgi:hypothetical protein